MHQSIPLLLLPTCISFLLDFICLLFSFTYYMYTVPMTSGAKIGPLASTILVNVACAHGPFLARGYHQFWSAQTNFCPESIFYDKSVVYLTLCKFVYILRCSLSTYWYAMHNASTKLWPYPMGSRVYYNQYFYSHFSGLKVAKVSHIQNVGHTNYSIRSWAVHILRGW